MDRALPPSPEATRVRAALVEMTGFRRGGRSLGQKVDSTVLSSLHDACRVRRALMEAARVTTPGGRVVIWEPRVPTVNRATRLVRESE